MLFSHEQYYLFSVPYLFSLLLGFPPVKLAKSAELCIESCVHFMESSHKGLKMSPCGTSLSVIEHIGIGTLSYPDVNTAIPSSACFHHGAADFLFLLLF